MSSADGSGSGGGGKRQGDGAAPGTFPRRRLLIGAAGVAAALGGLRSATPLEVAPVPVSSAAAAHGATSINQHLHYVDTAYFSARSDVVGPTPADRIIDLGVRCVRALIPTEERFGTRTAYVRKELRKLLEAGCDVHARIPASGSYRAALAEAKAFFGERVRLFEGFNEPYRFSSSDAAYAGQVAWWDLVRADPYWDDVPVIAPSDRPGSYFDPEARPRAFGTQQGANMHPYAGGRPPEAVMDRHVQEWRSHLGDDAPLYVTEFGWHTAINNRNAGHHGVSGDPDQRWLVEADGDLRAYPARTDGLSVQAVYLVRGLLENFRIGIRLSAIYELQNQKPVDNTDPGAATAPRRAGYRDMEEHFGLVAVERSGDVWQTRPLPSYEAVRRFQRRLADPGTRRPPATWPVRVDAPGSIRVLPLARRDGSLDLALWQAAPLQAGSTYSPADGDVRPSPYTVVPRRKRDGIADARHEEGWTYPEGSVAGNGDQDVEWAKYFGAVVGEHRYPAPVPAVVRLGLRSEVTAMHPCRSDALQRLGRTTTLTLAVPADPVLLRLTPG